MDYPNCAIQLDLHMYNGNVVFHGAIFFVNDEDAKL